MDVAKDMDVARPTASSPSSVVGLIMPRLPAGRKILYGVGQLGAGLQEGFLTLALFFYTQVIGLNAAIVGAGILAAGILDGVLDALVGSWSDSTRHRWGRRHPYLYYSAVPAGISIALLFMPPSGMPKAAVLVWLFVWLLVLRIAMTCYLIPHWAMGAELSDNPRERTTLVMSRMFFSFFGNGSVFVLSLLFFHAGGSGNALLRPQPYAWLALSIGIFTIFAKLISAFGTHKYVKTLPQPAPGDKALSAKALFREVRNLLGHRAFRLFFFAAACVSLGLALRALDIYLGTYFWKLPAGLILVSPGIGVIAFASGSFIWAYVSHSWGKKRCYMTGIAGGGVILGLLPIAKIIGFFPANGSAMYFPTIISVTILGNLFLSAGGVMAGSIVPDVMDDYHRLTGRKVAGIITGFMTFMGKVSFTGGQMLAGVALWLIGLQSKATVGSVPGPVVVKLGLVSSCVWFSMAVAFCLIFRLYPLVDDGARLRQDRQRRRSGVPAVAGALE